MDVFASESLADLIKKNGFTFTTYPALKSQLNDSLVVRPLSSSDNLKGYMDLLVESNPEEITTEEKDMKFKEFLSILQSISETYYPIVVEDVNQAQIVGAGTLIVEQKFIHSIAMRGRIENLKVCPNYRRMGLGTLMLEALTLLAKKLNCYKTTLNCDEELVIFCQNLDFIAEPGQNFMLKTFGAEGAEEGS